MIAREITAELLAAAPPIPVVTLTGPRQSGKTTLVKATFPNYSHVNLERMDIRMSVLDDPHGFLTHYKGKGLIIDEAQHSPGPRTLLLHSGHSR